MTNSIIAFLWSALLMAPFGLKAQHDLLDIDWSYRIAASVTDAGKYVKLAPAQDGGLYVSLMRFGDIVLPDGPYPYYHQSSMDALVFRLSDQGNLIWARQLTGKMAEFVHHMATDSKGNLIVLLASSSPIVTFSEELAIKTTTFSVLRKSQLFLAKFSPDGKPIWVNNLGNDGSQECNSMVLDAADNIYISGHFDKSKKPMVVSNSFSVPPVVAGEKHHSYVLKYSPKGDLVWGKVVDREDCFLSRPLGDKLFMVSRNSTEVPEATSISGPKNRALLIDAFTLNGDRLWTSKVAENTRKSFDGITACKDGSLLVYSKAHYLSAIEIDGSALSQPEQNKSYGDNFDKGTIDLIIKLSHSGKLIDVVGLPFNLINIEERKDKSFKAVGNFWPNKDTKSIGTLTDIPEKQGPCEFPLFTMLSADLVPGQTQFFTTCFRPVVLFCPENKFFIGSFLRSSYFPLALSRDYKLEKEKNDNETFIIKGQFIE